MPHRVALVLLKEEYDLLPLWEQVYRVMRHDFQAELWQDVASLIRVRRVTDPELIATLDEDHVALRQVPVTLLPFPSRAKLMEYINTKDFPKIDAVVIDIGAVFEGIASVSGTANQVSQADELTKTKIGIKPRTLIGVGSLFAEKLANYGCSPVCTMANLPREIAKALEPYKYEATSPPP